MKKFWKSEIEILSKNEMLHIKGGDPDGSPDSPPDIPPDPTEPLPPTPIKL